MRLSMLRSLLLSSAILLVAGTARASVTIYDSEAAFSAAHAAHFTVDFAGVASDGTSQHEGTPYTHNGLTFTSNANLPTGDVISLEVAGVHSQSNTLPFLNNNMNADNPANAPFLTTALNQASAVGFLLSQGLPGAFGSVGVTVHYGAGAGADYTTTLANVGHTDSFTFFGVDGLDKITSVTFSLVAVDLATAFLTAQTIGIAEVLYARDSHTVPVPEPGTLALLASGLLGLAWTRRRAG
jgi:hypothetical protein